MCGTDYVVWVLFSRRCSWRVNVDSLMLCENISVSIVRSRVAHLSGGGRVDTLKQYVGFMVFHFMFG